MLFETTKSRFLRRMNLSRTDKVEWGIALATCVLLVEGIIAAGVCLLTQYVMQQLSTDWLADIDIAMNLTYLVAAVLVAADLMLVGLWMVRPFVRLQSPIVLRKTLAKSEGMASAGLR